MVKISEHFDRSEFACKCGECDFDTVDTELIKVLESIRSHYNRAITITSGCRCFEHNQAEGGSSKSQHLYAKAVDFIVDGIPADAIASYLMGIFPDKYGIGQYNGRTHLDVRPTKARWDRRG